jgi:surfeit locus 1 family protein
MARRIVLFVLIAVVFAALFIRLGFWQLSRLAQRRARNALVTARLRQPLADLTSLPADSSSVLRRAEAAGTPDYDHEVILAARSYEGSPGVYLFTPLRVAGHDTAVLVNRGWIYSPDGVTIDTHRWREPDTSFVGYADLLRRQDVPSPTSGILRQDQRIARQLDQGAIANLIPYPVSRLYLVATQQDTALPVAERVQRLSPPPLDEGPHLSYAIQWFSFAAIALIGAGAVAVKARDE